MLVDNLDMFLIQPKGSGKFEVPELQLTKSTKRGINLNIVLNIRDEPVSQINVLPSLGIAKSGKIKFLNKLKRG